MDDEEGVDQVKEEDDSIITLGGGWTHIYTWVMRMAF